jgi:solute carrier family 35 protein C2
MFPETTGLPRIKQFSWSEFLGISIPCGVVTAADVGLSNLSMVSISLTFYTMVKASTPIFVLFWAWMFKIERITWHLLGVIGVIAMGEFLTVYGEANFVLAGFIQCLVASIISGARWTLVQLKLQTLEPPLQTSLATMRVLAPSMFGSILMVALAVERPWEHLKVDDVGFILALGGIGGTFAIAMTLCEFMLIMQASAIVLMIGGVVKELLNIGIGMAFFGDTLNLVNTMGFIIVFSGVILYKVTFHSSHGSASSDAAPPLALVEHYGPVAGAETSSPTAIHSKSSNESLDEFMDEEQPETANDALAPVKNDEESCRSSNLHRRIDASEEGSERSEEGATILSRRDTGDTGMELRESQGTLT